MYRDKDYLPFKLAVDERSLLYDPDTDSNEYVIPEMYADAPFMSDPYASDPLDPTTSNAPIIQVTALDVLRHLFCSKCLHVVTSCVIRAIIVQFSLYFVHVILFRIYMECQYRYIKISPDSNSLLQRVNAEPLQMGMVDRHTSKRGK